MDKCEFVQRCFCDGLMCNDSDRKDGDNKCPLFKYRNIPQCKDRVVLLGFENMCLLVANNKVYMNNANRICTEYNLDINEMLAVYQEVE